MTTIGLSRPLALILLWITILTPAFAVNEKGDGWPWNLKLHGWHDREVAEELGTGWFLNVGPTGIRAQIMPDSPKYLTVKYVFKKSPAFGLVEIGDLIVGANGRKMNVDHKFGRRGNFSFDGPMAEMAKLIEDSQGAEGKLELIVWPGGNSSNEKTVTIQIEPIGRFSETWPFNCPRSDKMLTELCDFLVDEYDRAGQFEKRPHTHAACVLALMAANDSKYDSIVKKIMKGYEDKRYDPNFSGGFPVWGQVHEGIVMGEYYLLTKDRSLEPAMKSLAHCLDNSVWPTTGGLSHKPFAAIQRRMAGGGPKGYGAMAMPAGLGMISLSLFKEAGLPYAEASYQRIHEGFLSSASPSGAIDYGFKDWDHAVIELTDPGSSPKNSPDGIGYECMEGLRGAGDYKIIWPTTADPRYRPTDWLKKEIETNRVFDKGGKQRLVIRNMSPEEPTKAFKTDGRQCGHHGRTGTGALAHAIGNADNESWKFLSDHFAAGAANSGRKLMDGHASTHMHVLWGSLGAAMAEEKLFRKYLEDIKWWMIMAHTHNGGYVIMPGRDYASTDHVYGTRNFPTACAALILSLKEKRLRITGATKTSDSTSSSGQSSLLPSARPARQLSEEKKKMLDESLLFSLAELAQSDELQALPMDLSKAATKVKFVGLEKDSKLTFQSMTGEKKASFTFEELSAKDHLLLARLLARLNPDSVEANATAGIYLEINGDTSTADIYYQKAGKEFTATLEKLFE